MNKFHFLSILVCLALPGLAQQLFSPTLDAPLEGTLQTPEFSSDIPAEIIAKVDPSVVSIQHERAGGTGFIISEDGYILTNGHVVQGDDQEDPSRPARTITVVLHNDLKYPASVIGLSLDPDVALLKINAPMKLRPVEFADSHKVSVGQRSFAVGTPIGLRRTFTSGILSNIERTDLGTETVVFQTDAAINQGNSGGPLFDQQGRVLGINTYGGRGTNNIGFTIPIHVARDMIDDFKEHGRFVRSLIPLFFTSDLYDELARVLDVERGILISYVMKHSSAWEAGLRSGDILVEVDGEPVSAGNRAELLNFEWKHTVRPPGETIRLKVLRGNGEARHEVEIETVLEPLGPLPQFARHRGEIPEYRYAFVGLGVKSQSMLHHVIHALPQGVEGVLVKFVEDNSTASKADIQPFDIITHVAGQPVTSLREFQETFEAELQKRNPAIEVNLVRRKLNIRTAIAPDYLMQHRHVALISASENSEYVDLMRRELLALGAKITVYTEDGHPVSRDLLDRPLYADAALKDLEVENYDVVLFAGGSGARALWENEEALRVVRDTIEAKRHLAAVGTAAMLPVLGSPEPLEEKITTNREDSAIAVSRGANYTGKDVESDKLVHTTTGQERDVVREFLTTIYQATLRTPVR
ncbi:MAG: trypsin-like peptidase domain-containing protein [Verrucomicrobia bacterium]|nr:trypsin-like peptidase domain-containing protein [Verrucomicrobiota bacterium]